VEQGANVGTCISCGDDFIVWRNTIDGSGFDLCKGCGGTNVASPGQRTKDPSIFIEEQVV